MGRKPKYSPQTKAAVLEAIDGGALIKDAAKQYGVSSDAAEKWVQARRAANPTAAASSATPNVTPGTVQPPKGDASGGAPGGGGAGGASAAAKAAGVAGQAGAGGPPPPPKKTEPEAPKLSSAQGLMFLTQMGLRGYVQTTANAYEVEMDEALMEAAILTDQECGEIAMCAPYMGGSFDAIMEKYGQYLGPVMFAFSFYMICSKRTMFIKRNSPVLAEQREERRAKAEEARMRSQRAPGFGGPRPAPAPRPAAPPPPVMTVPVVDPSPSGMPVQDVSLADLEKASKTFSDLEKKNGLDPARQLVDNINQAMGKKAG